jgi:GTP-binding protein YchF
VTKAPDPRLDALAEVFQPPKVTHATLEYLDFPAISKEALANPSYLASLRTVDAIAHVIRLFEDDTIPHEHFSLDAARDAAELDTELVLSDLGVVEKRLERLDKDRKKIKDPGLDHEFELLTEAKGKLENGVPLRDWGLEGEDEKRLRGFQFLSQKPLLHVLNLGEADAPRLHELEAEYRAKLGAGHAHCEVAAVCGKIEAELAEMSAEESAEFMASYGLQESGIERMIGVTYRLLGLMSFLTAGETEVRAWTIPIGSTALKAAGTIHTDFEKKFIRAEVVNWKSLVEMGGYHGLREKALLKLEGKEYIVQDGDVLVIRHG